MSITMTAKALWQKTHLLWKCGAAASGAWEVFVFAGHQQWASRLLWELGFGASVQVLLAVVLASAFAAPLVLKAFRSAQELVGVEDPTGDMARPGPDNHCHPEMGLELPSPPDLVPEPATALTTSATAEVGVSQCNRQRRTGEVSVANLLTAPAGGRTV